MTYKKLLYSLDGITLNILTLVNGVLQEVADLSLNVPILESGLIPARYLPSYVDDIIEGYYYNNAFYKDSAHTQLITGETGKIYVDLSTDLTYRWSGSAYIEVSKSIITGVKGDAESNYRVGNVNITAANIGLGNVANLDLSKAIKGITRSGTTFTYTCLDGTTGTFTQQDNNTTYSAGTGISLSGTTFSNSGVRATTINGNYLRVNTNGTNADLTIPYATSAGNADTVDDLHASNLVRFFLSPMTGGAPADSAKSWFTSTMPSASGAIVYNVPGSEKTIIAGKSSGSYGHMLQLNYDNTYLRILRYKAGNWLSTDWEKISAGYADSAGSVSWSNVTSKPTIPSKTSLLTNDSGYITSTGTGTVKTVDVTITLYKDVSNQRWFIYPMSEANSKKVAAFRARNPQTGHFSELTYSSNVQGVEWAWHMTVSNSVSNVPTSISGYYITIN